MTGYAPRLLGEAEAALYLGISKGTLRKMDVPRKVLGSRRLYDRLDLDACADDLPYEAGEKRGNTCDAVFGSTA